MTTPIVYTLGRFRRTFRAVYEQYREHHGRPFTVLRGQGLSRHGRRILYRIRFEDGCEIEAWPEEVCR